MEAQSLLASAGINIGVALIILSLFSVLKKHKCTSFVYYPRRLSLRQHSHIDPEFSLRRFLPSVHWIQRAVRVTEGEILDCCGLDALIVIRLFKFGYVRINYIYSNIQYIQSFVSRNFNKKENNLS